MGGLAILLILLAYLGASYAVVKAIKPRALRTVAVAVLVLIPTADATLGRAALWYLCRDEGELRVYRVASDVEGFFDSRGRPAAQWITEHGFQFVEGIDVDGAVVRLERAANGELVRRKPANRQSEFQVAYVRNPIGPGLHRSVTVVRAIRDGEVLARYTNISYRGGWAERLLARFTDAGEAYGGACSDYKGRIRSADIVSRALTAVRLK